MVAKIGSEIVKFEARLAGAEIKESPRRGQKDSDPYGKILEFRERMKSLSTELGKEDFSDCMKQL